MLIYLIKSKSSGGIETHITHLKKGFHQLGCNTRVFEVNFHPLKLIKDIKEIRASLKRSAPDIIHFHGYKALLLSLMLPKFPPKVCTVHGFLENKRSLSYIMLKKLVILASKKIDHFICVSNNLKRYFSYKFNVSTKRSTVIHNGVESTTVTLSNSKSTYVVGACGRLVDIKGYHHLIQAFSKLPNDLDLELHIVGDGPYRDKLEKIASTTYPQKVYFHGHQQNPMEYISKFDVFVQPSLLEGCGVAVLEAMSIGLPVVVSTAGGLPELVKHGVNGLVFPKGDVNALTKCLFMVLSNRESYRKLGEDNRKWVTANFSYTKMLESTIKIYKELMGDERYEEII